MDEIEKLFIKDVREKKSIAHNVVHRASRRKGFKGGVLTPYDLLSPKERKEYTKPSEVRIYMEEPNIITLDEFRAMNQQKKKEYLTMLHNRGLTWRKLAQEWGVSLSAVKYHASRCGLLQPRAEEEDKAVVGQALLSDQKGLFIRFSGSHSANDIAKRLFAIAQLLDNQEGERQFSLVLEIKEEEGQ